MRRVAELMRTRSGRSAAVLLASLMALSLPLASPVHAKSTTGRLQVTISGLPPGYPSQVVVTGPAGYSKSLGRSAILKGLRPGTYTVTATGFDSVASRFTPAPETQSVVVRSKGTATVRVAFTSTPLPPRPPVNVSATASDGQATVSWRKATSGSNPTSYTATSAPGDLTCTATTTTCTITGLTNGTAYTFTVTAQNSAGTSPPSQATAPVTPLNCRTGGTCRVGDIGPGGGVVYYAAPTRQPWGQYLEIAPVGWSGTVRDPIAPWGCDNTRIYYLRRDIGAGLSNTQKILAGCPQPGIAARLASEYRGGGKSDWFLPTELELGAIPLSLAVQQELDQDGYYWTSVEWGASEANYLYFYSFAVSYLTLSKSSALGVRPVRAF